MGVPNGDDSALAATAEQHSDYQGKQGRPASTWQGELQSALYRHSGDEEPGPLYSDAFSWVLEGDFLIKGGWEEELGETGSECVKDETRWETRQVGFGEDAGSTTEIFSALWRSLLSGLFFLRPVLFAAFGCCLGYNRAVVAVAWRTGPNLLKF